MPIEFDCEVRRVSRDEYHELDYRVMGHAFAVHRTLGSMQDERVYQNALRNACSQDGLSVHTEVPILCRHGSFEKCYSIDALAENAVVYELKAMRGLDDRHRGQLLNYLLMLGLGTGKLVNLGTSSVESEYVTTQCATEDRYRFDLDVGNWQPRGDRSRLLVDFLRSVLSDWGAFLSIDLYRDALVHLLGGEQNVLVQSPVFYDGAFAGYSRFHRLDKQAAFEVTGHTESRHLDTVRRHLQRRLDSSAFTALDWINFAGPTITVMTLQCNQSTT